MKTRNSERLLEKLRSRLPDADERLMTARENSLAELDAYDRLQRALARLTPAQQTHLAEGLAALSATLTQMDTELAVTLTIADGRHVTVLAEDLLDAATLEAPKLVAAG